MAVAAGRRSRQASDGRGALSLQYRVEKTSAVRISDLAGVDACAEIGLAGETHRSTTSRSTECGGCRVQPSGVNQVRRFGRTRERICAPSSRLFCRPFRGSDSPGSADPGLRPDVRRDSALGYFLFAPDGAQDQASPHLRRITLGQAPLPSPAPWGPSLPARPPGFAGTGALRALHSPALRALTLACASGWFTATSSVPRLSAMEHACPSAPRFALGACNGPPRFRLALRASPGQVRFGRFTRLRFVL